MSIEEKSRQAKVPALALGLSRGTPHTLWAKKASLHYRIVILRLFESFHLQIQTLFSLQKNSKSRDRLPPGS
jgi:hypothetical protein